MECCCRDSSLASSLPCSKAVTADLTGLLELEVDKNEVCVYGLSRGLMDEEERLGLIALVLKRRRDSMMCSL